MSAIDELRAARLDPLVSWFDVYLLAERIIEQQEQRVGELEAQLAAYKKLSEPVWNDEATALENSKPAEGTWREVLEDLTCQFAYWNDSVGGIGTGGLSALEAAFELLGWDDPHPLPEGCCDEPGCKKQISCGTPTPTGYRQTCHEHRPHD